MTSGARDISEVNELMHGMIVKGNISNITSFGVFVRISPAIEVLCPLPNSDMKIKPGHSVLIKLKKIKNYEKIRGKICALLD